MFYFLGGAAKRVLNLTYVLNGLFPNLSTPSIYIYYLALKAIYDYRILHSVCICNRTVQCELHSAFS